MTIFENVKTSVTPKDAAERYGVKLSHNNMFCCPFHNDRQPSMKLNDDYFYCFGCGAHGDVIDFTAKLFEISLKDAAEKLAYAFGIDADKPVESVIKPKSSIKQKLKEDENYCFRCRF